MRSNMPIEALQAQVEADGTSWRQYREEVREQLITNEVQRAPQRMHARLRRMVRCNRR